MCPCEHPTEAAKVVKGAGRHTVHISADSYKSRLFFGFVLGKKKRSHSVEGRLLLSRGDWSRSAQITTAPETCLQSLLWERMRGRIIITFTPLSFSKIFRGKAFAGTIVVT